MIKHAFEEKEHDKWIKISARAEKEHVWIEVADNGSGITEKRLEQINQKLSQPIGNAIELFSEVKKHKHQEGMGLTNVHHRIKLFFGEQYGVEIFNRIPEGTVVRITVPLYITKQGSDRNGEYIGSRKY